MEARAQLCDGVKEKRGEREERGEYGASGMLISPSGLLQALARGEGVQE